MAVAKWRGEMVQWWCATHMRRMLPSVWSSRSTTIVIALGTLVSGAIVTLRDRKACVA